MIPIVETVVSTFEEKKNPCSFEFNDDERSGKDCGNVFQSSGPACDMSLKSNPQ